MTKGNTKREIDIILTKLEQNDIDFCIAQKEINKIIDRVYSIDANNYFKCHSCEEECYECKQTTSTCL